MMMHLFCLEVAPLETLQCYTVPQGHSMSQLPASTRRGMGAVAEADIQQPAQLLQPPTSSHSAAPKAAACLAFGIDFRLRVRHGSVGSPCGDRCTQRCADLCVHTISHDHLYAQTHTHTYTHAHTQKCTHTHKHGRMRRREYWNTLKGIGYLVCTKKVLNIQYKTHTPIHTHKSIYIYIYTLMCVCVCICARGYAFQPTDTSAYACIRVQCNLHPRARAHFFA